MHRCCCSCGGSGCCCGGGGCVGAVAACRAERLPCCAAEAYELGEKGARGVSLRCRDGGGLAPDDAPAPGDGNPRGLRFFGAELAELASLGGLLGRLVGGS